MTASSPLSRFESLWLAEIVRRFEEKDGAMEDASAVKAVQGLPADLEERIVARAEMLGERGGWRDDLVAWRRRWRLALLAGSALAFVVGAGTAWGVLGDGSRPVNIVWAFGGLLGIHALSLLLWLGGMALRKKGLDGGGFLAQGLVKITALTDRSPKAGMELAALNGLANRMGATPWLFGVVTHLLWAFLLSGALLGVLTLLATRRYGFTWETTILSSAVFVHFVELTGFLPGLFGFDVPSLDVIASSGQGVRIAKQRGARGLRGWWAACSVTACCRESRC